MRVLHRKTLFLPVDIQHNNGTTRAPGGAPLDFAMRRGRERRGSVDDVIFVVAAQTCSEVKGPFIPVPRDPGESTHSGKHKIHRIFS